ncbi:helix-turn-helix transcriptional regulator [Novosphingobium rosa]|uniref:helix-turn-helix transcriptional regulator n=1 Tax=Novosphingobium rosa TaxID=76978 RepID=UPI000A762736|nr:sigma factor-like helix-turn-helix DNA-binding protein [Novosphingobium rosa]
MHEGSSSVIMEQSQSPQISDEELKRLQSLSQGQIDCLRLAGHNLQTKEIAVELNMSPGRVDKQILHARQKLDGLTRREAARLVLRWEEASTAGQSVGAQSMSLFPTLDSRSPAAVDHEADAPQSTGHSFAEGQLAYAYSPRSEDLFELAPLRRSRRPHNDLSPNTILISIAKLTLAALVLVGAAVSLLSSLDILARH